MKVVGCGQSESVATVHAPAEIYSAEEYVRRFKKRRYEQAVQQRMDLHNALREQRLELRRQAEARDPTPEPPEISPWAGMRVSIGPRLLGYGEMGTIVSVDEFDRAYIELDTQKKVWKPLHEVDVLSGLYE